MGLVPMEFRRAPERPSNRFGKDEGERPHDVQAEEAWLNDARDAVARRLMLGCEVTEEELTTARFTAEEAMQAAAKIEVRIESEHKRLTLPPEPKEVGVPVFTYVPDPELEQPAPKRRRKKRATSKALMRQAIEHRHEERLFTD